MDIVRYRRQGLGCYDFGGYYTGTEDIKKLQINKFKSGFGGATACNYNFLIPNTWVGKIALMIRRLRPR